MLVISKFSKVINIDFNKISTFNPEKKLHE